MYPEYNTLRRTPGLVTWLLWVVLTSIGGSLGTTMSLLNPNSTSFLNQIFIWFFLFWPLFFVALGQWLLLRRFVAQSGWWLLTSVLGFFFVIPYLFYGFSAESTDGKSLIFGTSEFWGATLFLVLLSLICGSIVGLVQSGLVIWCFGKRPRRRLWWVSANALAWAIGFPLGQQVLGSLFWLKSTPSSLIAAWVMQGATWGIIGIITGAVLVWLGRTTMPER